MYISRNVKIQSLATFDIEYLFLNVRAKSVGESVDVNIRCPDDKKQWFKKPLILKRSK